MVSSWEGWCYGFRLPGDLITPAADSVWGERVGRYPASSQARLLTHLACHTTPKSRPSFHMIPDQGHRSRRKSALRGIIGQGLSPQLLTAFRVIRMNPVGNDVSRTVAETAEGFKHGKPYRLPVFRAVADNRSCVWSVQHHGRRHHEAHHSRCDNGQIRPTGNMVWYSPLVSTRGEACPTLTERRKTNEEGRPEGGGRQPTEEDPTHQPREEADERTEPENAETRRREEDNQRSKERRERTKRTLRNGSDQASLNKTHDHR